jgi:hypothetical protein
MTELIRSNQQHRPVPVHIERKDIPHLDAAPGICLLRQDDVDGVRVCSLVSPDDESCSLETSCTAIKVVRFGACIAARAMPTPEPIPELG